MLRIPETHSISDLARNARSLIERAIERQVPIIITQRGWDAAVLLPIELYRRLEAREPYHIASPRLVHRKDASRFVMQMEVVDPTVEPSPRKL